MLHAIDKISFVAELLFGCGSNHFIKIFEFIGLQTLGLKKSFAMLCKCTISVPPIMAWSLITERMVLRLMWFWRNVKTELVPTLFKQPMCPHSCIVTQCLNEDCFFEQINSLSMLFVCNTIFLRLFLGVALALGCIVYKYHVCSVCVCV